MKLIIKTCSVCKQNLPATDEYFHKRSMSKDGLTPACKKCRITKQRAYHNKNSDSINEKIRKDRINNNDKYLQYSKDKYERNKEKLDLIRTENKEKGVQKICSTCGKEFPSTNEYFSLSTDSRDGLIAKCKICSRAAYKEYRVKNKEKRYLSRKKYETKNVEKIKERNKIYRAKETYKIRVREYERKYRKSKRSTNKRFAINGRMSESVRSSLRRNKNGYHWENLVGYTLNELMEHLEKHFLPDMCWENRDLWQIDHIKPLATFNYESYDDPEFKKAWSLSNLQPLWSEDNNRKQDKWNPKQEDKYGDIQLTLIL